MPLFEAGTTFLDHRALNIQGEKPKYFIGMNDADDEDDVVVAFVFNTEHRMDLYHPGCNKEKQKFVLEPKEISYLTAHTSVMLSLPEYYHLKEIINYKSIKILDKVSETLTRQVKNCLDLKNVATKYHQIIKDSFK